MTGLATHWQVSYDRGRHYEFIDREGILQTGGEGRPTINSVRLKHDESLSTKEHQDGRIVYQAWLRDYEGDDSVILKDVKKDGRLIEVQIRNKYLKCLHGDSSECIHVGFALALPEVRMVLNK